MAFGETWGIVRDFTRQIQSTSPRIGDLEEAIFDTKMPQLALSTIALLDVSDLQNYPLLWSTMHTSCDH